MKDKNPFPFSGITDSEVANSRQKNGSNSIAKKSGSNFLMSLKDTVTEPMFLLLIACTVIYFSLGAYSEAWFMLGAIILVSGISFYQDNRSKKALEALKEFTQPEATVIRNNALTKIKTEEIVIGDYVVASEGKLIPADGTVKQVNDFSVNESILTGEAFSITKEVEGEDSKVFSGTFVEAGQCVFEVTAIGASTKLGQIGTSISEIATEKTPLQLQISSFVRSLAIVGTIIFILIWLVNYLRSGEILSSLLKGLTIAMSVLPEEIPVAFTTFMALGAWRLMKTGIIVKQASTVEALGSATVLCTDKTGTITENKMELLQVYDLGTDKIYDSEEWKNEPAAVIISTAMWASEIVPFDTMEKALHAVYTSTTSEDERKNYTMVHEYPLGGKPPMMTHIFENAEGNRIVACKGAPEAIMNCCDLNESQKEQIEKTIGIFTREGLRVLGVATTEFTGTEFPKTQQEFKFDFSGLVAFYDPPKKNIAAIFKQLYTAGIAVKIITGDNALTTTAIAKAVEFEGYEKAITSEELLKLNDTEFDKAVMSNNIFARMFPDLKLKIIESLKKQGEIVGMTGDGVNDGPALKAAHIGIAMGKRGSEIAKQASSLILTDDDFGKMTDAVAMGRRIYTNLKKAIQYIISIHIPIILIVAIPSFLNWKFPNIFSPIHVIFLELIMGPTCSIIYENEPLEANGMSQPPRSISNTFFKLKELTISIIQGLGITIVLLLLYQYGIQKGYDESLTRTMVFTTLIIANVMLTLVNRSFYYSVFTTMRYKNNLLLIIVAITLALLALLLYVPVLSAFFQLTALSASQVGICAGCSFTAIAGFEVYKWVKRRKAQKAY